MLKLDEVVIGGGLSALVYAYSKDATLIRVPDAGPSPFDFFEPEINLSSFFLEPVTFELKTNTGVKVVGIPKLALWERLSYMMSLSGRLPFSDKVKSIRVDQEKKTVRVAAAGNSGMKLGYDKLRVFDDTDLHGLESCMSYDLGEIHNVNFLPPKKFKILDWFNVRSGCRHEYDYFCTNDDLVKEVYFYPSERVDGKHDLKDLVAVSYLTEDQIHNTEYSDTYARFKVLGLMKENGIRGTRNGRDQKNPEKYKYYAVRIEATARDVILGGQNINYENNDGVTFDDRSVEKIIKSTFLTPSCVHKTHKRLVTI